MNRSMKQMLSALLAVAMVAALLVVPSFAADKLNDGIYKLTADTTPVTVKVNESVEQAVKAEYQIGADTYAVVADANITVAVNTAVATAQLADGQLTITGVAAGQTDVVITVKDTALQATIPVTVAAAADGENALTLSAKSVSVAAGSKKSVTATVTGYAGKSVYAVSEDTAVAAVAVSGKAITVTGVAQGQTSVYVVMSDTAVTLAQAKADASVQVLPVTVTAKSTSGGATSGRPDGDRPGNDQKPTGMPFTDVKADDWFFDSVHKAFQKGLMKGTSETTFDPTGTTTRAMVATVLYRMTGEQKTDVAALFEDVDADTWYTEAVAWAAEKEIVKGYDDKTFAPNDNVTREQLAVMLYRCAAATAVADKDLSAFADAAAVSDWAVEAMTWAVDKGIIQGKGDGSLDPKGLASRAEVCTMLVRYLEMK